MNGVYKMKKRSFVEFFEDGGLILVPLCAVMIGVALAFFFAPYETTNTLYVDGNA